MKVSTTFFCKELVFIHLIVGILTSTNLSASANSSVPSLTPIHAKSTFSVLSHSPSRRKYTSAKKQKSKSSSSAKYEGKVLSGATFLNNSFLIDL